MSVAPPATRDGWSYSGEFHVEASNHNRHRRATIPEIKAIFDGSDGSKDRPAHWYEAQLIHYGLPPSKTKGTAKMRILDALNQGNLVVPGHIRKVESELKKEWTKREREAKQALKKPTTSTAKPPASRSNKRKADDGQTAIASGTNVNINLSLSVGVQGNVQATVTQPAPKKARTLQTARRGTSSSGSSRPAAPAPSVQRAPRERQTARRSRPFNRAAQGRATTTAAPQFDATPSQWGLPDDPPPPYPGSNHSDYDYDYDSDDRRDDPIPLLGLLNGRYRLRCTSPAAHADDGEDSAIILTLDGDALWGSFEIGPLSGVLYLAERPRTSSRRPLCFAWRGDDAQGGDHDETNDGSYLMFMGDGVIVGKIGFYNSMLEFSGYRISGAETRSEISAASMRREWEDRRYY